ncbi:MAG: hypothetical protein L3J45_02475 [Flavobacteriaceae bacterium]|nr:hypothetical protein [Flavobacteriaceae bacterium]
MNLTFSYSATPIVKVSQPINGLDDLVYLNEEEADVPFDFDYKAYLPKGFNPYDLTDNGADITLWVEEEEADESFDFDYIQYLPVGFNPNKELNTLFLEEVEWVDEDEDEAFNFDTKAYFNKSNSKTYLSSIL